MNRHILPGKIILLLFTFVSAYAGKETIINHVPEYDINSALMLSTFKIYGDNSSGTCFIVVDSSPEYSDKNHYIMFTAAHVLEEIIGEYATIAFRIATATSYETSLSTIRIRMDGTPLWIENSSVDIAAIPIEPPWQVDIPAVGTLLLADSDFQENCELHTGDELRVLGYPFGQESNSAGFPILRSGHIASYPIFPVSQYPTLLLDLEVFPGNSGGPVYISTNNQEFGNKTGGPRILIGILTQRAEYEHISNAGVTDSAQTVIENLNLAIVAHSEYMIELVKSLEMYYGW